MRHVAFLRGMNVGGHRVTNAELIGIFVQAGLANPVPYQASGNVVFESDDGHADLTMASEHELEQRLGYGVPVFLRTRAQLLEICARDPFDHARLAEGAKPQVILLRHPLGATEKREVNALAGDEDSLVVVGTEIHWLPSRGVGKSELDMRSLEATVGTTTVRTTGTIERLVQKFF